MVPVSVVMLLMLAVGVLLVFLLSLLGSAVWADVSTDVDVFWSTETPKDSYWNFESVPIEMCIVETAVCESKVSGHEAIMDTGKIGAAGAPFNGFGTASRACVDTDVNVACEVIGSLRVLMRM